MADVGLVVGMVLKAWFIEHPGQVYCVPLLAWLLDRDAIRILSGQGGTSYRSQKLQTAVHAHDLGASRRGIGSGTSGITAATRQRPCQSNYRQSKLKRVWVYSTGIVSRWRR